MDAEILVTALLRLQLVASAAILVVLLLRPLALRWCGAGIAYWLWLIVPLAAIAALLPAREQVVVLPFALDIPVLQAQLQPEAAAGVAPDLAAIPSAVQPGIPYYRTGSVLLMALWLLGAGAFLFRSIVNTRRLASSHAIGPALVGVLRPRLVLPRDFEVRFNAEEQALILAHEEMHRVSRHTLVNALVEVARCASWFNPLMHLAAVRFRADQELACDTAVIAAHPEARRTYAEALLKAQVAGTYLPMGCVWTSSTAGRLAERIARLSKQLPGRRRRLAGAAAILGIGMASGYAAWAQQPVQIITTVQEPRPESAAVRDSPAPEVREAVKVSASGAKGVTSTSAASAPVLKSTPQASQGATSAAEEEKAAAPNVAGASDTFDTRTPTTVNGLRANSTSNQAGVVDLNIIPSDLQRRMDVVTGGASATYGSGAVAGVVNMVLNNRLKGFSLDMDYGTNVAGGGGTPRSKSPAAEFASESVDEEWSSRKRKEIIESMTVLEGVVSTAQVDCKSSSCRVELKWPNPPTDESEDQRRQREQRIGMWAQEVSKRSGFVRSDTGWVANLPGSLSYFTMKPIPTLTVSPREWSREGQVRELSDPPSATR